jgi:hypothetical protein
MNSFLSWLVKIQAVLVGILTPKIVVLTSPSSAYSPPLQSIFKLGRCSAKHPLRIRVNPKQTGRISKSAKTLSETPSREGCV